MSRRWRWLQAMLASIFRRRAVDAEIRAELEEHMERRAEALVAQGVEPEAARRRAVAEFGSAPRYEEESREAYGARWLEAGWQDLRLAVRGWRKAPGLGALIVLVLALGLGAATAVFTLVDAALLASWPFPHSDQVMFLARLPPPKVNLGYSVLQWGRTDYLQFARHQHAFSEVAAFQPATYTLTGHGEPLQLDAYQVSASFFTTLGARPQLGCWFTPAEDKIGASGAVVISDQLWRQQLGANPRVVGTVLDLSGKSYTVVGVMPAGFAFPRGPVMPPVYTAPVRPEFWVPMALPQGGPIKNEPQTLAVIGRLAPGFTRARADADLAVFARRMETAYPRAKGWFSTRAVPITEQASGAVRTPLLLMLAAVGLVFLLACINIAGVLLARGLTRSQEFAVRLALGADRLRLARQLLIEVLPLALGGGALGLGLGSAGVNLVRHFGPVGLPHLTAAALDSRVVLFALTMTLLAAVLCALAPAWQAARHTAGLRAGARDLPSGGSAKARRALLTAQVAMAVMVVIGAGLLLRSLRHLLAVPTGIRPEGVLTFAITLPDTYNQPGKTEAFYRAALGRLRAIPGVTAAGIAETLPVDGATNGTTIRMPGRTYRRRPNANYTFITPGYFAAIGATLLRGRDFTASDTARSPVVVIISEAMARMYWPQGHALGQQVGPAGLVFPTGAIVGVVADIKHVALAEVPYPEMYVVYSQHPWPSMLTPQFAVRSRANLTTTAAQVRQVIHTLDPGLAIANVAPLTQLVSAASMGPRFTLWVMSGFALFALLLAALGIYGVVALEARQRTQEFGLRLALGAPHQAIVSAVLAQAARPAGAGLILGLLAAFAASRALGSVLYEVNPADPVTFAAVAVLLGAVTVGACLAPARRAARLDPRQLLRGE